MVLDPQLPILAGSRALEKGLAMLSIPPGFGESSLHFLAGLFSFYDIKYDYD